MDIKYSTKVELDYNKQNHFVYSANVFVIIREFIHYNEKINLFYRIKVISFELASMIEQCKKKLIYLTYMHVVKTTLFACQLILLARTEKTLPCITICI